MDKIKSGVGTSQRHYNGMLGGESFLCHFQCTLFIRGLFTTEAFMWVLQQDGVCNHLVPSVPLSTSANEDYMYPGFCGRLPVEAPPDQ